jgi:site-specific DNA-methyltransferase (adenine-specific)
MRLLLGDCLDKLKELDDNSVDSIVTDPPYGLSFMGKKWDYDVPSQDVWEECIRVLKPGGHLLAFAGSRTYHRMTVRIEDAGFEIRDQLMWIYGSGFPKSMNVGMKVDEKLGNKRELVERPKSEQRPNADNSRDKNKDIGGFAMSDNKYKSVGNSEWEGWGTALKPSHEPIVMARKPLIGTVVDNVLEWGTGGINIDESRIQHDEPVKTTTRTEKGDTWNEKNSGLRNNPSNMASADPKGRFPANIIFDEEAGKILDEQSGQTTSGKVKESKDSYDGESNTGFLRGKSNSSNQHGDKGGASRFFYCPKTSKTDRNEGLEHIEKKQNIFNGKSDKPSKDMKGVEKKFTTQPKSNFHPTVKPTDLMAYLVRMVTPKGGTVLDPFMGSGSTGKAAVRGGFDFVGIEREEEYMKIAKTRIQYEEDNPYNEETKTRVHINENANKFW